MNEQTGEVAWQFTSLDPETGQPPQDPLAGFLPLNQNPPEGEGYVTFSISPKKGISSGAKVRNEASIIFDTNKPIITNEWLNIVDAIKPKSNMLSVDTIKNNTKFKVAWRGSDSESGIHNFTIFVSENGQPFKTWLTSTSDTVAYFEGIAGKTYGFYCLAVDSAGNIEEKPVQAEVTTKVLVTSLEEISKHIPETFALYQNYPNPFNLLTTIKYNLNKPNIVNLKIYNISGQEIETLVNRFQTVGEHVIIWQPKGLPGGIYICRLQAEGFIETKKLILQK